MKDMEIDGKPIVVLPKKNMFLCKIKFSEEERINYNKIEVDFRSKVQSFISQGSEVIKKKRKKKL